MTTSLDGPNCAHGWNGFNPEPCPQCPPIATGHSSLQPPKYRLPLEVRIGAYLYRVHFKENASAEIAHIDKKTRRRSGRYDWRWIWPTGKVRETATSRLVRDHLLALAGKKLGQ